MIRGILFGTVAFGTVFLLERQLGNAFVDMRRYDKLRAMSGESSLLTQGFKALLDFIMRDAKPSGERRAQPPPNDAAARSAAPAPQSGGSIFDTIRKDVLRYAVMRSM